MNLSPISNQWWKCNIFIVFLRIFQHCSENDA